LRGNALFGPLGAAFAWGRHWSSLLVLLVLIARVAGLRLFQAQAYASATREDLVWLTLAGYLVPAVIDAALICFLAQALLAREFGRSPPLLLRALGVYLLASALTVTISAFATLAVVSGDRSSFAVTYLPLIGLPLGAILTFPLLVRAFAAAAGIARPTLGPVCAFAFGPGRFAFLWFAICVVMFHLLPSIVLTGLQPAGTGINGLPGTLVVSAITGTGVWLRFLLAIVAAQMAARTTSPAAQVFA